MSERAVAYPAPTVAVVPVRIGSLKDQLALRFGQILAQPFVLQEKRAHRMSKGISKGLKKTIPPHSQGSSAWICRPGRAWRWPPGRIARSTHAGSGSPGRQAFLEWGTHSARDTAPQESPTATELNLFIYFLAARCVFRHSLKIIV